MSVEAIRQLTEERLPGTRVWDFAGAAGWFGQWVKKKVRISLSADPDFRLVVLAETKIITRASVFEASARPARSRPSPGRRRITESLRQQVIQHYARGNVGAQAVGDELGLAKSTVLRILKQADIDIRPQGHRLT